MLLSSARKGSTSGMRLGDPRVAVAIDAVSLCLETLGMVSPVRIDRVLFLLSDAAQPQACYLTVDINR